MKQLTKRIKSVTNRRSFLRRALTTLGTAGVGAGLLSVPKGGVAQESQRLTSDDAAILRFVAAAEIRNRPTFR